MSDLEKWKDGEPLNFAFYKFADLHQREQLREPSDLGRTRVLTGLMYGDLFGHIASGQLMAYGFRTTPTVSDGPVQVPSHCFEVRPNSDECQDNIITASGWRYERVHVIQPHCHSLEDKPATQDAQQFTRKAGRPSTYAAVSAALTVLHSQNPDLIKQSPARLLARLNEEYPDHARAFGLASLTLSERAFRDHLYRFRQELVENGNNDFAS